MSPGQADDRFTKTFFEILTLVGEIPVERVVARIRAIWPHPEDQWAFADYLDFAREGVSQLAEGRALTAETEAEESAARLDEGQAAALEAIVAELRRRPSPPPRAATQ